MKGRWIIMIEEGKYTYLSECRDFNELRIHLSPDELTMIEDILEAYNSGKVSLNIVRDEKADIIFDKSFDLIINDKTYLPTNSELVSTVLKWYEGYDNTTDYVVDYIIDYILEESSKDVEYDMHL